MHLTDDEALLWDIEGGERNDARADHVVSCIRCTRLLESTRSFIAELERSEVWSTAEPSRPPASLLHRISALESTMDTEEMDGRTLLQRFSIEELESRTFPATVGTARALIDASYNSAEKNPFDAERYATLAIITASALPAPEYPRELIEMTRGAAWRQRANALRMRGAFVDAHEALDSARYYFGLTRVAEPENATLDYIRATLFLTEGRLDPALKLLESATEIFRRYADDVRMRNAKLLMSGLHQRKGDSNRALELLHDLLASTPSSDVAFRGRILLSLGVATLECDPDRAQSYLQQARHCLDAASLPTETLRADWNLGRAALRLGDSDRAEATLQSAFREAGAWGLAVDGAMIALDLAELFVRRNDFRQVAELCTRALEIFTAEGVRWFGAEAFAYLERVARSESLGLRDVDLVREYIEGEDSSPRPFVPPVS